MFQHARPGKRAFLGDMTDQKHGDTGLLCIPCQFLRAFAHLCHATGGRLKLLGVHRLNRVDDRNLRFFRTQGTQNGFQPNLRQQWNVCGQPQALRSQGNLVGRFLSADIQCLCAGMNIGQSLQQQGRFSDSRITANQHHPTPNQTAPQHAIKLRHTGFQTRKVARLYRVEAYNLSTGRQGLKTSGPFAGGFLNAFRQGVPFQAVRALPLPFAGLPTALGTNVDGRIFSHAPSYTGAIANAQAMSGWPETSIGGYHRGTPTYTRPSL